MRLFHIGDLHLGKKIYDFSMLEDQKYILEQILQRADEAEIDGILISGDIYDKPVPAVEAVRLLDAFLTALAARGLMVFMIAGNHDSAHRLDFGGRLMAENKVHIAGSFSGRLTPIIYEDAFGEVAFYLLPFIKPATVSPFFETEIDSYQTAVAMAVATAELDMERRNILLAHQFVTWKGTAEQSDSEVYSLGGIDQVDASVFWQFDYTALGHLHSPQKIGREEIRFAGSPLAYSFSEMRRRKSITMLTLEEKGKLAIEQIPLEPMRPFREIKGPLAALVAAAKAEGGSQDYIRAILTDFGEAYDPLGQLRVWYPQLMTLEMENQGEREVEERGYATEEMSPDALFRLFFEQRNDKEMNATQQKLTQRVWEGMGGGSQ